MTETNLKAFALEQGWTKQYKELDQLEKMQLRYQYVLANTTNAQGDFARTSDGYANSARILKESLKEAAATMGEELLPVVTPLIGRLSELVQHFADMDEGTRKALVTAGLFLATLGPATKLTGGLTSALGAGISAYKGLKEAQAAATAGQSLFNTAIGMSTNPLGAIVTGVGAVISVLAALSAAMALAGDGTDSYGEKVKELTESLEEAREERQKALEEIEEEKASTLDTVEALTDLVDAEEKTVAEKETIKKLVDDLNESVPGLALAYDEQTDSLNMTAEAVRELAIAEAERAAQKQLIDSLAEAYTDQARIDAELAEAEEHLAEVQGKLSGAMLEGTGESEGYSAETEKLSLELLEAQQSVDRLKDAQQAANNEIAAAEDALNRYTPTVSQLTATDEQLKETTDRLLNATEGLTEAEINEQIAALQSQKRSAELRLARLQEAQSTMGVTGAVLALAKAYGTENKAQAQIDSANEQIAALEKLKASLNSANSSTGSSSKKAAKEIDKQTEAYKKQREELDHLLTMGQIKEEEYYSRLAELRDEYLSDDKHLSDYRKVTEEIYKYDQNLAEKEKELWREQTEELAEQLEDRLDAVTDKQQDMEKRLSGYGDLFETNKKGKVKLGDLQKQIDAMDEYAQTLDKLKEAGVSQGLMDEIASMDIDEAVAYGKKLLAKNGEELEEYVALWEEKQAKALEISSRFYSEELKKIEEDYNAQLGAALDVLTNTAYQSGVDTAEGLLKGLESKERELYAKAGSIGAEIARLMSAAEKPLTVDGSHAGGLPYVPFDGYVAELHRGERVLTAKEAQEYIRTSIPSSLEGTKKSGAVTKEGLGQMLAQTVNALNVSSPQTGSGDLVISVPVNGAELARAVIKDFRQVSRADPEEF